MLAVVIHADELHLREDAVLIEDEADHIVEDDPEVSQPHAAGNVIPNTAIAEVEVRPADDRRLVHGVLHATFPAGSELPWCAAEKDTVQKVGERAFELQRLELQVFDGGLEAAQKSFRRGFLRGIDGKHFPAEVEIAPHPVRAQHGFRQQLVSNFGLEATLFAGSRRLPRPLLEFLGPRFELLVDGGVWQDA